MKTRIINFLFLILLCSSFSLKLNSDLKQPRNLPNSEYLYKGYDIFFGDLTPRDGDIDPGFRANVFRTTYDDNELSSDRRFFIPDGYHLTRVEGCSIQMRSTTITGENSYINTFESEVGVTGTIKGVKFSASTTFKNISEQTTKNEKAYIYSKSDCRVYSGRMDPFGPPLLHRSFLRAVRQLNGVTFRSNPSAYWRFIENFGTHYVYEARMGARFGAVSMTTQNELSRLQSNTVGFSTSIGIKDLWEVSSKISNENVQKSNILTRMEDIKVFSIGSKPDPDLDPRKWSSKSIDEPMPISYSVRPILEIFEDNGQLNMDRSQFEGIDRVFFRNNFREAVDNYCAMELLPRRLVNSCELIRGDAALTNVKNTRIENGQHYYLQNVETRNCITETHDTQTIVGSPCGSNPSRQGFQLSFILSEWKIHLTHLGRSLDVVGGNSSDGARIATWGIHPWSPWQHFQIVELADGNYNIRTHFNKCLQTVNDNRGNMAPISHFPCNHFPGQAWIPIRITDVNAMRNNNYLQSIR